jgi:hypothetical protein
MRQRTRIEGWAARLRAAPGDRACAARLLELTVDGWRLFVNERWPERTRSPAACDMLLIGPGGLFAIDIARAEAAPPYPAAGSPTTDPSPKVDISAAYRSYLDSRSLALLEHCKAPEHSVGMLGISPVALQPVLIVPGRRLDLRLGRVRVVGEQSLYHVLLTLAPRLDRAGQSLVYRQWAQTLRGFAPLNARELPEVGAEVEPPEGLFDVAEAEAALLEARMAAPIERWMTFLSPQQSRLVSRTFNGPARISGPAGTGKTVVGLHRAVHLAQRSTKKVLVVTHANNLPPVQRTLARQLSPETAERIEFTTLHKLALSILSVRGVPVNLQNERAETLVSTAWLTKGGGLKAVVDNARYWIDEINFVIKGRMIEDLPGYRLAERRGRRLPLRPQDRELVWEMYEEYERLRRGAEIEDFNDVLAGALAEVRRAPLDPAYAAVIVDEVQDLTLTGVRLLHAVGGDGPDGLLLIGDGQQAVYPGGYRLSEAGVTVPGARGVVLTRNYRNRAEILQAAMKVVAEFTFDDIDESTASGNREVETAMEGGTVTRVRVPTINDHDRHLIKALSDLRERAALGDAAVLCPNKTAADGYQRILRKAGLETMSLENYDGTRAAACKVGTYTRVKGLDFKHVFIPRQELAIGKAHPDDASSRERIELARRRLYVAMIRARDSLWLGTVHSDALT